MSYYILDENKNTRKVSYEEKIEWARRNTEANRIALDEIDGITVSTVFLGIDHSADGGEILFETMIFAKGSPLDQYQERCTTYEEALAGHAKAVNMVREGLKNA